MLSSHHSGIHMMSSTKLEVNNVLHWRQTRTEVTRTEKFIKFGHVVFEICKWTDRQTCSSQNFSHLPGRSNHTCIHLCDNTWKQDYTCNSKLTEAFDKQQEIQYRERLDAWCGVSDQELYRLLLSVCAHWLHPSITPPHLHLVYSSPSYSHQMLFNTSMKAHRAK